MTPRPHVSRSQGPVRFFIAALLSLTLIASALGAPVKFDIPAQPASTALQLFIKQSGTQVAFAPDEIKEIKANALNGDHEPAAALALLLKNTGLAFKPREPGWFVVTRAAVKFGSVQGSLLTPTRRAIEGVHVTVAETGEASITDRRGIFQFPALVPGAYTLVANGEGFTRLKITDVVVRPGNDTLLSAQEMPGLAKDGDVQTLKEIVVSAKKDVTEMSAVEVSGEKLKPFTDSNVDLPRTIDDPQPRYIFNAQTIEQSGATNIEEFLSRRLTMGSTPVSNNDKNVYNAGFSQRSNSTIALRGLGATQTLILVNGRRMANVLQLGTSYQADLNGIPLSAIDRIEVLPSSSSGIYGGGAVGGVINIITKHDYVGGEVRLTYNNSFENHAPSKSMDALIGLPLEKGRTQLMLTARYAESEPLLYQDRAFLQEYFSRAVRNNPSAFTTSILNLGTASGSILAQTGNLAGTTSNFVLIPAGYRGVALDGVAPLVAAAGQLNLTFPNSAQPTSGLRQELSGTTRNKSFKAELRRQMTSRLEFFADASYADTYGVSNYTPLSNSIATVPATAPTNPFRQIVSVGWQQLDTIAQGSHNYTRNISLGFKLKLPHDWMAEGDYTWNQSLSVARYRSYDFTAFGAALANGTIDPFRDVRLYPIDIQPYLYPVLQIFPATANLAALRAAGPVWTLPGGEVTLATSGEHRKEGNQGSYVYNPTNVAANASASYYLGQTQNITSAYAELSIPVFGTKNALPGVRSLELQVAGRKEYYGVKNTRVSSGATTTSYSFITGGVPNPVPLVTTHGLAKYDSTNVTLGFTYKPVQDVMFRFSNAPAFVPPTYAQLLPGLRSTTTSNIVDPKRGNATTPVFTLAGGNPDVTPEESQSQTAGLIVTPRFARNLRLSVDYTWIKKDNNIGTLTAQQIVTNEDIYPDRVTRDPVPAGSPFGVGPITLVNISTLNLHKAIIETFDSSLSYRWETQQRGVFNFQALGTWQTHFQQRTVLGAPLLEYVGTPAAGGPLKFRAVGSVTWEYKRWVLGWTTSHYNGYNINGPPLTTVTTTLVTQGAARVPSQMYHDVFASYKLPRTGTKDSWRARALDGAEVQFGVKDVFNTKPPFDAGYQSTFYRSPYGSLRLAEYTLSLKKPF